MAFSSNGKLLAAGSRDGSLRLWDLMVQGDKPRTELKHGADVQVMDVRFSRNGEQLVTTGLDGTVRVWDVKQGREARPLKGQHLNAVEKAVFSSDGSRLATAS